MTCDYTYNQHPVAKMMMALYNEKMRDLFNNNCFTIFCRIAFFQYAVSSVLSSLIRWKKRRPKKKSPTSLISETFKNAKINDDRFTLGVFSSTKKKYCHYKDVTWQFKKWSFFNGPFPSSSSFPFPFKMYNNTIIKIISLCKKFNSYSSRIWNVNLKFLNTIFVYISDIKYKLYLEVR